MTAETLQAKRRAAQRKLDQAQAPLRQVDLAAQELAAIEAQIAQAEAEAEAERLREIEHKNKIAGQQRLYARLAEPGYRDRMEIRDWARDVTACRQRLVALGKDDPGDIVISAEATYALPAARVQRREDAAVAIVTANRASPEEEARYTQRRAIEDRLFREFGQTKARKIATLVADEGMTLEQAIARQDAPELEETNVSND